MSRRSNYTAKFKTKIVLEVLKEEKELGVIAAENNLNPNMVRKWRKEFLENAESVFENPTQIEKDFAQLYIGQNRKLLVENYYKKKKRILTLLFLAGLSIVSVIFWQGLQERKLEGGNKLERNDYGQGRKEVELEVQLGEEKWQPLLVTLEELEYSFEEIEEGFDKVEEMLPEIILGKNYYFIKFYF